MLRKIITYSLLHLSFCFSPSPVLDCGDLKAEEKTTFRTSDKVSEEEIREEVEYELILSMDERLLPRKRDPYFLFLKPKGGSKGIKSSFAEDYGEFSEVRDGFKRILWYLGSECPDFRVICRFRGGEEQFDSFLEDKQPKTIYAFTTKEPFSTIVAFYKEEFNEPGDPVVACPSHLIAR